MDVIYERLLILIHNKRSVWCIALVLYKIFYEINEIFWWTIEWRMIAYKKKSKFHLVLLILELWIIFLWWLLKFLLGCALVRAVMKVLKGPWIYLRLKKNWTVELTSDSLMEFFASVMASFIFQLTIYFLSYPNNFVLSLRAAITVI